MTSVSGNPSRSLEAHVITSDSEAIAVAKAFAERIAPGAAERDRGHVLPRAELTDLATTGLLGITVPREYGGADVTAETVAEVFRIISAADPAIGQTPQNHFFAINILRHGGTPTQQAFFFAAVLAGARFGNALSERGTAHVFELRTRIVPDPTGQGFRISGRKYYCTGALTAQWIPVYAVDPDERVVAAFVERDAPGVEALDDWTAMGQRGTVSGTVVFDEVEVEPAHVVLHYRTFDGPQVFGAFGQLMHAAIDVGIAENALSDAAQYVRERTRPHFEAVEAGIGRAADEPHVIYLFGKLAVRLHAAQAMLARAARAIDDAAADLTVESAGAASLAVAEAKAFGGDVAVQIASDVFELTGTSATDEKYNLHRHWRNARTHTLHDPARWKYHHAGNHALNGVLPPNHELL